MALFSGRVKEDAVALKIEAATAQTEVKFLRGQIVQLNEMIKSLQQALISKEAPIAYRDMQEALEAPADPADRELAKAKRLVFDKWDEMMDKPLFGEDQEQAIEELTHMLGARAGIPDSRPIDPSNSES